MRRNDAKTRSRHFNSRAHVERDSSGGNYTDSAGISTHALMWSATRPSLRAVTECRISTHALMWSATCAVRPHHRLTLFQLTRSCGARRCVPSLVRRTREFQLTRSCGARRKSKNYAERAENFNSRAHVERDAAGRESYLKKLDFNSRAHVERDPSEAQREAIRSISTHALTWSATLNAFKRTLLLLLFQLTRSRGARLDGLTRLLRM